MTAMWTRLSPRERILVALAGGLLVILLLSMVVIRPILSFQSSARADYDAATETYQYAVRAARTPSTGGDIDISSLRTILTRSANQNGIIIERFNAQGDALDLSVGPTTTQRLYVWLATLNNEHGVTVREASLRPAGDGQNIAARLTVAKGAS